MSQTTRKEDWIKACEERGLEIIHTDGKDGKGAEIWMTREVNEDYYRGGGTRRKVKYLDVRYHVWSGDEHIVTGDYLEAADIYKLRRGARPEDVFRRGWTH